MRDPKNASRNHKTGWQARTRAHTQLAQSFVLESVANFGAPRQPRVVQCRFFLT